MSTTNGTSPAAQASVQELTQQEFIYHPDQTDPNGEQANEAEELSRTQIIMDVVKSLRTGKDLYRISLPAALLKPVSMLEYISLFLTPQSFILESASLEDPEQRMLAVVKWWINNMIHIPKKGIIGAKPYNAVLGEVFGAKFIHKDSKTLYMAEQVSHHPPISAVYMTNRKKNLALKCVLKPKSKFHGNSASTLLDGEIIFQLLNLKEQYHITFPHVVAKGLIWGQQGLEMNEFLKIKCTKTGLSAKIEFKVKSENEIKGSIKHGENKLFRLSGSITDKVMIKNLRTKNVTTFIDAANVEQVPKYVKPVVKQNDNESRKVWHKVSYALNKCNYTDANIYKNAVEEEQRGVRKQREERGEQFVPHYFKQEGESFRCLFENVKEYTVDEQDLETTVDMFTVTEDEKAYIKRYAPDTAFNV